MQSDFLSVVIIINKKNFKIKTDETLKYKLDSFREFLY